MYRTITPAGCFATAGKEYGENVLHMFGNKSAKQNILVLGVPRQHRIPVPFREAHPLLGKRAMTQ